VTHDGIVKLLDFGVAALQTQATQPASADTGPQPLTPGYAAPEQLRGDPVSTAADVYALGVLLYVLVTGEHPYGTRHSTRTQLVRSALTDEAAPASERLAGAAERRRVRGDLDAVIARALSRDPAARYTTAAQFASDIRAYLGNFPVHARAPTRAYAARKFAQRHWGGVVSALLILVILIGATVVTTLQTLEARRQRDFARTQLARAQAINELNRYVLFDAAPGETFTTAELLRRALHVLERQKTTEPNRVTLLTSVGFGYEMQNDHAAGKRILTEAYDLSRATSDASARANAACALADSLSNEHNTPRSEALIKDGLRELPRGPEFALDRYFCLLRGQQVAKVSGDTQLAIRRGEAALAALKDVPFAHDLEDVEGYESLASTLREAGRMHEAQASYAIAWPRLVALGRDDTFDAATLLGNWAQVLLQMGRPLEAQQYKQRELEIKLAVPDPVAASMSLTNYAQLLFELARLDEAADYAERAYREAVKSDNQLVLNQTRLRLARIYREKHDSARAARMLDEAEVPMRQLLPPGHFAFASLAAERALLASEQEDFPRALELINQALEITEEAGRHGKAGAQFLPILLTHRAEIELAAAQLAPASSHARQALALLTTTAQPGDYSVYAGRAELTLARVLAAGGESSESRRAANRAVQHLTKAEGADHPETLAAVRLSSGPSLDERIQ
jgi:tetratricopeptide (TPR) repeat protein